VKKVANPVVASVVKATPRMIGELIFFPSFSDTNTVPPLVRYLFKGAYMSWYHDLFPNCTEHTDLIMTNALEAIIWNQTPETFPHNDPEWWIKTLRLFYAAQLEFET
jgi:hypothetical protein